MPSFLSNAQSWTFHTVTYAKWGAEGWATCLDLFWPSSTSCGILNYQDLYHFWKQHQDSVNAVNCFSVWYILISLSRSSALSEPWLVWLRDECSPSSPLGFYLLLSRSTCVRATMCCYRAWVTNCRDVLCVCFSSKDRPGEQRTSWFLWNTLFFSNMPYTMLVPLHSNGFLIQEMVMYSVA